MGKEAGTFNMLQPHGDLDSRIPIQTYLHPRRNMHGVPCVDWYVSLQKMEHEYSIRMSLLMLYGSLSFATQQQIYPFRCHLGFFRQL